MMKSILFSAGVATAICFLSADTAKANRVANGDFEDGLNGWTFTGDGVTDTASLSSDTPSGAGMSADLNINGPNGLPWLQQDIDVSGLTGLDLTFSASVKELRPASPDDAWIAGQVWMLPNSGSGLILSSVALFYSSPDWFEQTTNITVPAGANVARVLFTPQNPSFLAGNGQYLIDDVSLVVPEPSTCILAMLSIGGLLIRRKC
ncbi:PEP-CTERM sorting domain-containing protein [Bythopirellula goksoeyrii]|uniref:PEP-CTERM protein-sorting domain-containing protein n=1 Tax=Bythopirellula goksoeyrii TaxID=1400387 RepID=A0A5B9QLX0_9BACT|nr:PEP-CTERM sorting domain-containing protein [Bythopirellula goksoeyrii]QEG35151.1 hypothetical protein Pr1d_24420 [Bythopirellula goksoeyrii]